MRGLFYLCFVPLRGNFISLFERIAFSHKPIHCLATKNEEKLYARQSERLMGHNLWEIVIKMHGVSRGISVEKVFKCLHSSMHSRMFVGFVARVIFSLNGSKVQSYKSFVIFIGDSKLDSPFQRAKNRLQRNITWKSVENYGFAEHKGFVKLLHSVPAMSKWLAVPSKFK